MKYLIAVILFITALKLNAQEYDITKFGVKADSNIVQTKAIQKVIDLAASRGGGKIVIPKGTFLTGALFFKKKTKLVLKEGAVLKGSDDIKNYPFIPSRMEGRSLKYFAAVVNAYQVNDFSIEGPGTINGNGLKFWKTFWSHRDSLRKIGKESTNLEVSRPRLIFIWGSDNVKIQNIKLRNAGFWTTHFYKCNNILVENTDIRSPYQPVPAPSTDGIDLDVCKNVVIRNCYISVNDDAIAIKGGKGPTAHQLPENGTVEDVLIENCTFGNSHAVLTLGSECVHANNIILRNCVMENNCPILNLKMRGDTFQIYENITIDNITGKCGSVISLNPWKQFFDLAGSTEQPFGTIRNIKMSNIKVEANKFGEMNGNPLDKLSGFTFQNLQITTKNPVLKNKYDDVKYENVIVNGEPLVVKK
ncbi:glycosyl hydrolase family 28 protein [Pedobacter sp. MC2016-05]|uniref:glycoside hydrolase family 28 protein n=1 Tax=Pedobacter sp. MC2016-05 TaxID=2994474 RepID=UPI0022484CA8|nr:glycosyl hydrolase family 28 protein [Pedobacter sp. MC2016-05]MCX2476828.1 glycosyl hydrolase family 28 protein [Pedobacter sp. MC2016-05]